MSDQCKFLLLRPTILVLLRRFAALHAPPRNAARPSGPSLLKTLEITECRFKTSQLFLPLPEVTVTKAKPRNPSSSWLFERSVPVGLDPLAIPEDLDLNTPRVGRVFKLFHNPESFLHKLRYDTAVIAMFPASNDITDVPPYPGVPPATLNNPMHPDWCHINGTQGAYDGRHYPQLFNARAPWLPFHDNPQSLAYEASKCEIQPVDSFFKWNSPGSPAHGGYWIKRRLLDLYSQRERYEMELCKLMAAAAKKMAPIPFNTPLTRQQYDLPFYDPSELEDTAKLTTWANGREIIAYTAQYTAEVKAINRWLRAQLQWLEPEQPQWSSTSDVELMGTWSPTISSEAEWQFLRYSRIPIYIIIVVPPSHALSKTMVSGNLDGDERYRNCSLEWEHSLKPLWRMDSVFFQPIPTIHTECLPEYIPRELLPVRPPLLAASQSSTSHLLTWRSPIYMDTNIRRDCLADCPVDVVPSRHRLDMEQLFPYTPPRYNTAAISPYRHPLLDAIAVGFSRDTRLSRFEEVYDEQADGYFPRRIGRKNGAKKVDAFMYCFRYPDERIEICSDHSFPGLPMSYGLLEQDEDEDDNVFQHRIGPSDDLKPRRYFPGPPSEKKHRDREFTWVPRGFDGTISTSGRPTLYTRGETAAFGKTSRLAVPQTLGPNHLLIRDDPVYSLRFQLDKHTPNDNKEQQLRPILMDYASQLSTVAVMDPNQMEKHLWRIQRDLNLKIFTSSSPTVDAEVPSAEDLKDQRTDYEQLFNQRNALHSQIQRRMFKPRSGDGMITDRVYPWDIPGGTSGSTCYPIRISNIHGETAFAGVFALLERFLDIRQHEVVLFTRKQEVDTTLSFDLGLRYAEDALLTRAYLHGVDIDGRYLEVQHLHAMAGGVQSLGVSASILQSDQRTLRHRIERTTCLIHTTGVVDYALEQAWLLRRELDIRMYDQSQTLETRALIEELKQNNIPFQRRKPIVG
jgi:hypothetical protein